MGKFYMGFLDFFAKKKSAPAQIDYTDIILKSWDIFRQGLKHPNPEIRRAVEEAVWYVDNPEGKRYFATGMQEPDLNNKAFCLQRLYERGGWRLAENIVKIALNEEEISLDLRERMIYYIGGFSDSNAAEFLIKGLESKEPKLRIASIAALAGVKNGESMMPVYNHLQNVTDKLERFVCGIVLYQYNHTDGKSIIDSILKDNRYAEYIDKLRYLDFNKAKPFLEEIINSSESNNKNVVISMIDDNRGVDILKKLLKDSDPSVINSALNKIVENGSRSAIEEISKLEKTPATQKSIDYALAAFNDKIHLEKIEKRLNSSSSLNNENLEDLKIMGLVYEHDISALIDKLLTPFNNLEASSSQELDKITEAVKLLIKYGKINSILNLDRYVNIRYLENEDIDRWKLACYSAAAILCIVERNTTYYNLRKKAQEQDLK